MLLGISLVSPCPCHVAASSIIATMWLIGAANLIPLWRQSGWLYLLFIFRSLLCCCRWSQETCSGLLRPLSFSAGRTNLLCAFLLLKNLVITIFISNDYVAPPFPLCCPPVLHGGEAASSLTMAASVPPPASSRLSARLRKSAVQADPVCFRFFSEDGIYEKKIDVPLKCCCALQR